MVRKIQGKGKSRSLGHLNVNEKVTSGKDIYGALADVFSTFRKILLLKIII